MPRRRQFKAICHDLLDSFVSRYNDINGYWALGQFANFLKGGPHQLLLDLRKGKTLPSCSDFNLIALYYARALRRLMSANDMPQAWVADAVIGFSMIGETTASCHVEVITDLGTVYCRSQSVEVRPHDPLQERRRADRFGPSNQKGE